MKTNGTQPFVRDVLMILVMNGASRSMQSFNSQMGTGSIEHCLIGACRISWAASAMLSGVNDSSDPETLLL